MRKLNEVLDADLYSKYQGWIEKDYDDVIKKHEDLKEKMGITMNDIEKDLALKRMLQVCKEGVLKSVSMEDCQKEYWKRASTKYGRETKRLEEAIARILKKLWKLSKKSTMDGTQESLILADLGVAICTEFMENNVMPYSLIEKVLAYQEWKKQHRKGITETGRAADTACRMKTTI